MGGVSPASCRPLSRPTRPRKGAEGPDHESEFANEALERLEWADGKQEEGPHTRMRAVTRRTALTGAGAGLATAIIAACGGGGGGSTSSSNAQSTSSGTPASGIFGAK